jgi:hypothetical protein
MIQEEHETPPLVVRIYVSYCSSHLVSGTSQYSGLGHVSPILAVMFPGT